jgi:hypothetical protein
MTGGRSYGSPSAFRRALTDKLRDLAARSRWTLQQLQRQMAYDRLLERLYLVDEGWIITVRPGDHPSRQARNLQVRVHPAPAPDPDMFCHQLTQGRPLRQGHHRHQAGPRHEIRVIKPCLDFRQVMQQSHLRGVLSAGRWKLQELPSSQFRGHLSH